MSANVLAVLDRLMNAPCDVCSGDCGSANPPVACCPMRESLEARAAVAELIAAVEQRRRALTRGEQKAALAREAAALARCGGAQ